MSGHVPTPLVRVGSGLVSHAVVTRSGQLRTLCGFASRFHRLTGIADGEPTCIRCRRALRDSCPHGDPTCPCPDGDVCHYVDDPETGTKAWEVQEARANAAEVEWRKARSRAIAAEAELGSLRRDIALWTQETYDKEMAQRMLERLDPNV